MKDGQSRCGVCFFRLVVAASFKRGHQKAFDAIREQIDQARSQLADRQTGVVQVQSSDMDELEKLASLRDRGIVTEEEFQQKKQDILGL